MGIPHGTSELHLASGVTFLNEEEAVLEAMFEGWLAQRIGGRNLQEEHVMRSIGVVRRFQSFTNEMPWTWSAGDLDEWMTHLTMQRRLAKSTIRSYQGAIRLFCEFITSPHYGWAKECLDRFGNHPVQICHEWNTLKHLQDYDGVAERRPLSRDELQLFFDHADSEIQRRLDGRRKGALPVFRDAMALKVAYAWGLRASEVTGLDITDFYRNASAPEFGELGSVIIRKGKGSRGQGPKRRAVASLFDWAVDALRQYIDEVRPLMVKQPTTALFLSERGTRMRPRRLSDRFAVYRDQLGLEPMLSPHALRHSYATHLTEEGVDPLIISELMGHEFMSTTGIYTHISGTSMNKMMQDAIGKIRDGASRDGIQDT